MINESHRVYTYITEDIFYAFINEAKREGIFTDKEGRVDIGALLKELVITFSEGRYAIVPKEGFVKEGEPEPEKAEKPKRKSRAKPKPEAVKE
jgi:hypothetical protein